MRNFLLLFLFCTMQSTCFAETTYHRFGDAIYGSDGSETRRFGDVTTIKRNGREVQCREFGGRVTCRDR